MTEMNNGEMTQEEMDRQSVTAFHIAKLQAEVERLNKALEQATSNSLGPRLPDPSHTVTVSPDSVEFPNEGGYPVFAQCPELAAWLKENRS